MCVTGFCHGLKRLGYPEDITSCPAAPWELFYLALSAPFCLSSLPFTSSLFSSLPSLPPSFRVSAHILFQLEAVALVVLIQNKCHVIPRIVTGNPPFVLYTQTVRAPPPFSRETKVNRQQIQLTVSITQLCTLHVSLSDDSKWRRACSRVKSQRWLGFVRVWKNTA